MVSHQAVLLQNIKMSQTFDPWPDVTQSSIPLHTPPENQSAQFHCNDSYHLSWKLSDFRSRLQRSAKRHSVSEADLWRTTGHCDVWVSEYISPLCCTQPGNCGGVKMEFSCLNHCGLRVLKVTCVLTFTGSVAVTPVTCRGRCSEFSLHL